LTALTGASPASAVEVLNKRQREVPRRYAANADGVLALYEALACETAEADGCQPKQRELDELPPVSTGQLA